MQKVILALHLVGAAAIAQQQPAITEQVEVSIVNVDVSVTGNDGQPIRGLSRNDFEVLEDGRRQAITNFYAVKGSAPAPSGQTPAADAPAVPPDPRLRRRVLVLVDVFHTTRQRRALALANLERLMDDSFRTGDYDWSIGILGRGVTIVLPLTTDKQQIHLALDRMVKLGERHVPALSADVPVGSPNPTPDQASLHPIAVTDEIIDRAMSFEEENRILAARFTARAIVDTARGFASASGRKIVLLLTGDLGMNDLELTNDNFSGNGGNIFQRPLNPEFGRRSRDLIDLRTAIVREANASGVSMYIFNIEGLQPMGELGVNPKPVTNTSAVFWLAKDTGGRLVTGNDGAIAVRQFDSASSNYYSLGYRAPDPQDGKYHQIEVRLKNVKGAKLEYRSGYSAASSDADLARSMESPIARTLLPKALPVTLFAGSPEADRRGVVVPISVRVPFSSLQFLPVEKGTAASVRVFISVFDDVGKKLFSGSFPVTLHLTAPDAAGVMVYKNQVVVGKGTTDRIVAAVKDEATDSVGTASIVVSPE
jgi:VWFA-related protein